MSFSVIFHFDFLGSHSSRYLGGINLSRYLGELVRKTTILSFEVAGVSVILGVGSGDLLLVLTLFLSERVFSSSVAFRLKAGKVS
jgi:hypothetical protein